jgi:hypothetical protein
MVLTHRRAFQCCCSVVLLGAAFASGAGGCAASGSDTEGATSSAIASTGVGGGGGGGGGAGGSSVVASVQSSSSTVASSTVATASSSSSGAGGAAAACGNGVQEPGEACDQSDFGGKTCKDYGLETGSLQCNAFCGVVVSGCTPPEDCGNGDDDDKDGDTDCADSDCSQTPACTDSCIAPAMLSDGDFDFVDSTGRPDVLKAGCSTDTGPEVVYAYTAGSDVDVVVSLTFTNPDMSLSVRTACNSDASEIACANDGGIFDSESLGFKAVKGTTYYIVADGTSPFDYGSFAIELAEVLPESSCDDFFDDDQDGLVDCADPMNCQGSLSCVAGNGAVGAPCMDHKECKATANDPLCIDEAHYGWPGGYCTEYCNLANNDCPAGSVCADPSVLGAPFNNNGLGVCFKTCTKKVDCAANFMCSDFGAGFVCKH